MSGHGWQPTLPLGIFRPTSGHIYRWHWIADHRNERRTRKLLSRLQAEFSKCAEAGKSPPRDWLLRRRSEFRQACASGDAASIHLFLAECPAELRPLGAWLLERCADRFRHHNLRYYCADPSPKVRRRIARALWRLEAWRLLDAMAKAFPEEARFYATLSTAAAPRRPSFAQRLKAFGQNVDYSHAAEAAGPSPMPYWSRNDPWEGKQPKSAWYIRWILWRIRRWVHGG